MKKTKIKQRLENARNAFYADDDFSSGQIAFKRDDCDLQNQSGAADEMASFRVWAFAKCLFFYIPGVALLYAVTLFWCDYLFVRDNSLDYFIFSFVWLGFATFLTMFGIGKLKKLKYLRVVVAVLTVSFAIGSAHYLLPRDVRIDTFYYLIYFLPLVAFLGYLAKRRIDREEDVELL